MKKCIRVIDGGGQDSGILVKFFLAFLLDRDEVKVKAQKSMRPMSNPGAPFFKKGLILFLPA